MPHRAHASCSLGWQPAIPSANDITPCSDTSSLGCRSCQENKPASEFYRYTYSKDGLYQQCKACHARAGETRLAKLAGGDSDNSGKPPVESKVPF